jgi:hypothetical protein
MEVIFWISVTLFVIAAIAVGHTVRKHNRMFKDDEDPVPCDDMPGKYDDVDYSERPFITYN